MQVWKWNPRWFLKGIGFIYQWYPQILCRITASHGRVHHPFHKGILCFWALNFPVGYMKDILVVPSLLNDPVCLVHWLDFLIIYCSIHFWGSCISVSIPFKSLTKHEVPCGNTEAAQLAYSYMFGSISEFSVLSTNVDTKRHKAVVIL